MDDPPPSPPHIHLIVRDVPGANGRRSRTPNYLGGYDERTLKSVWADDDEIILCKSIKPVQMTFFA